MAEAAVLLQPQQQSYVYPVNQPPVVNYQTPAAVTPTYQTTATPCQSTVSSVYSTTTGLSGTSIALIVLLIVLLIIAAVFIGLYIRTYSLLVTCQTSLNAVTCPTCPSCPSVPVSSFTSYTNGIATSVATKPSLIGNIQGLNAQGLNVQGLNVQGLNVQGLNAQGLNAQGFNQTMNQNQNLNNLAFNQGMAQGLDNQINQGMTSKTRTIYANAGGQLTMTCPTGTTIDNYKVYAESGRGNQVEVSRYINATGLRSFNESTNRVTRAAGLKGGDYSLFGAYTCDVAGNNDDYSNSSERLSSLAL